MRIKKAYTMIELILVIVVMGIVASIGADIVSKLYSNYITTNAINKLQAQTELALNQIAKRLTYRIKGSTIARNSTSGDYVALPDANGSYQILEWIGKDNESFKAIKKPGWSGFVDLYNTNDTNRSQIKTSGSDLNTTSNIIKALSNNKVSLLDTDVGFERPAIIFKGGSDYDISQYGWGGTRGKYTYRVTYKSTNKDVLNFVDWNATYPSEAYEQYDLAWSAYAIVPKGTKNDFNLTLCYNYRPWADHNYTDANNSVIIEHASTFRFTQIGETIRIKLCIHDNNQSGNFDFSFCKEKVIF